MDDRIYKPNFFIRGIALLIDLLIYAGYFYICGFATVIVLIKFVNPLLLAKGYIPSSDITAYFLILAIISDVFLIITLPLLIIYILNIQKSGKSIGKIG